LRNASRLRHVVVQNPNNPDAASPMNIAHHSDHQHRFTPARLNFVFAFGVGLNIAIVVMQASYGLVAHSTALLADAGHNLGDVLSLLIAWGAASLAKLPPTERFTYGLRSTSIMAAVFNALFLLVVMGGIAWEAIRRLSEPVPVQGYIVMTVAGTAIVLNGISAWLFAPGRRGDVNLRGAFLHMLSDALVSLGVVVAGGIIVLTGWSWIDPVTTLLVVGAIVFGTWDLLKDSFQMALAGVPAGIDLGKVRLFLSELPGVSRVHDLHIWPLSTTQTALTCHLVMSDGHPGDHFTSRIAQSLHAQFNIEHSTLQIELSEDADCRLASDDVI
jgi:cobalt-zinc-cadmium efflux system protein